MNRHLMLSETLHDFTSSSLPVNSYITVWRHLNDQSGGCFWCRTVFICQALSEASQHPKGQCYKTTQILPSHSVPRTCTYALYH